MCASFAPEQSGGVAAEFLDAREGSRRLAIPHGFHLKWLSYEQKYRADIQGERTTDTLFYVLTFKTTRTPRKTDLNCLKPFWEGRESEG